MLREGGSAWAVMNYYRDNPHWHQWGLLLAVRTHRLSVEEWGQLLRDAAQLSAIRAGGGLLVHGNKPTPESLSASSVDTD